MEGEPESARRYVRLPEDCVSLCAENLGIQASREVTSSLTEDVSFRIRQITSLALEFMRHARRTKLCKEDFDKALKWSGIEPLYGLHTEPSPFMYVHENGLYCVEDQEMALLDLALPSSVHPTSLPPPPTLHAKWLSLEGVDESSQSDVSFSIQLKRTTSEVHQRYLSLLLESVTGDSEEIRRVGLGDILNNSAIINILPELVHYLLETLNNWMQFSPAQLLRPLRLLSALFKNTHLFLEPYAVDLFPLVQGIILTPTYLHMGDGASGGGATDHWRVRQLSAKCLVEILARCASPLNEYVPTIHASFRHILGQSEVTLPVLYGVVLSLCSMGGKSLAEVLFPCLDRLTRRVQGMLDSPNLTSRAVALRVYNKLLLSSEILLTSGVYVDIKPEHISSPSFSSSAPSHINQPLPSHLAGSGDASFLTGFAPNGHSIMDTGDLGVPEPPAQISSLYDFLVELFGERLILRLTKYQPVPPKSKTATKMDRQRREGDSIQQRERQTAQKNDLLLQFLKREGFRSYKVRLRLKPIPHKPPAFHPWGRQLWRFHIPTPLLPVQGNMLEEGGMRRRGGRGVLVGGRGSLLPPGSKGRMQRRRGRIPQPIDLRFLWL